MPNYCVSNLTCMNVNCKCIHYKPMDERRTIAELVENNKEEMGKYLEEIKPKVWNCRYGVLCHHNATDCKNNHSGFALEARKIVKKALNKHVKMAKIAHEVDTIKTVKPSNWADEC